MKDPNKHFLAAASNAFDDDGLATEQAEEAKRRYIDDLWLDNKDITDMACKALETLSGDISESASLRNKLRLVNLNRSQSKPEALDAFRGMMWLAEVGELVYRYTMEEINNDANRAIEDQFGVRLK
jgi:hypothetical protein